MKRPGIVPAAFVVILTILLGMTPILAGAQQFTTDGIITSEFIGVAGLEGQQPIEVYGFDFTDVGDQHALIYGRIPEAAIIIVQSGTFQFDWRSNDPEDLESVTIVDPSGLETPLPPNASGEDYIDLPQGSAVVLHKGNTNCFF